jgi:D-alanyl-D-alanine carboxypeptidase (penicillin-binding protein 5/6)
LAALAIGAVLLVLLWPSDGSERSSSVLGVSTVTVVPTGCPVGDHCPQGSSGPSYAGDVAPPIIAARSAEVMEASCEGLLYGKSPHLRLPPASLTKIATALVAADRGDLSEIVDIDVNSALLAVSNDSTVMGLEPGQRLTMRDLLYGLLLPSGSDAAVQIAEHVGGTVATFVEMMNAKALALGLIDTHFTNPHGLDEAELYSSAYDMALLGRALLANPELAAIVRTKSYRPDWDGAELWNGNELLDTYPGAIGIKTGYTERAGQTMVAAAERGGRRLIVAVLGSTNRFADVVALFDWAFANTQPAC